VLQYHVVREYATVRRSARAHRRAAHSPSVPPSRPSLPPSPSLPPVPSRPSLHSHTMSTHSTRAHTHTHTHTHTQTQPVGLRSRWRSKISRKSSTSGSARRCVPVGTPQPCGHTNGPQSPRSLTMQQYSRVPCTALAYNMVPSSTAQSPSSAHQMRSSERRLLAPLSHGVPLWLHVAHYNDCCTRRAVVCQNYYRPRRPDGTARKFLTCARLCRARARAMRTLRGVSVRSMRIPRRRSCAAWACQLAVERWGRVTSRLVAAPGRQLMQKWRAAATTAC
jgi:hypothetical protein